MSNDLISRSAVINLIDKFGYINCQSSKDFEANSRVDEIRQGVVELPTAYDVDNDDTEEKKNLIKVNEVIEYCKKCAEVSRDLSNRALGNVGHGESEISALGAASYFLQEEKMYRYDIPNVLRCFTEEKVK